jgi:hypothetical protein
MFLGSGTEPNEARLYTTNATARANIPLAAIAEFKSGDVPSGQFPVARVGGTPIPSNQQQWKVLKRWPNNSVKQAQYEILRDAPAGEGNATVISFGASATNSTSGSGVAKASTEMALGAVSLALTNIRNQAGDAPGSQTWDVAAIFAGATIGSDYRGPRVVNSGPVCVHYQVKDTITDTYTYTYPVTGAKLRFQVEIEHWHTIGRVKVVMTTLNDMTDGIGDLRYDVAVSIGGTTVYTDLNRFHQAGANWTREYWIGGDPFGADDVWYVYSFGGWRSAGGMLNIDPSNVYASDSFGVTKRAADFNAITTENRRIFELGGWSFKNASTGGGREEIGHVDGIVLHAALSGNPVLRRSAVDKAYRAGSFQIHLTEHRQGGTPAGRFWLDKAGTISGRGYPVNRRSRQTFAWAQSLYWNIGDPVDHITQRGSTITDMGQRWNVDNQHLPHTSHMAYLMTRQQIFMELAQMVGSVSMCAEYRTSGEGTDAPYSITPYTRRKGTAFITDGALRGIGWPVLALARAYQLTPDDHPMLQNLYWTGVDVATGWAASLKLVTAAEVASFGADVQADVTWWRNYVLANGSATALGFTPQMSANDGWLILGNVKPGNNNTRFTSQTFGGITGGPGTTNGWTHAYFCYGWQAAYEAGFPFAKRVRDYSVEQAEVLSTQLTPDRFFNIYRTYYFPIERSSLQPLTASELYAYMAAWPDTDGNQNAGGSNFADIAAIPPYPMNYAAFFNSKVADQVTTPLFGNGQISFPRDDYRWIVRGVAAIHAEAKGTQTLLNACTAWQGVHVINAYVHAPQHDIAPRTNFVAA